MLIFSAKPRKNRVYIRRPRLGQSKSFVTVPPDGKIHINTRYYYYYFILSPPAVYSRSTGPPFVVGKSVKIITVTGAAAVVMSQQKVSEKSIHEMQKKKKQKTTKKSDHHIIIRYINMVNRTDSVTRRNAYWYDIITNLNDFFFSSHRLLLTVQMSKTLFYTYVFIVFKQTLNSHCACFIYLNYYIVMIPLLF